MLLLFSVMLLLLFYFLSFDERKKWCMLLCFIIDVLEELLITHILSNHCQRWYDCPLNPVNCIIQKRLFLSYPLSIASNNRIAECLIPWQDW